jgi:hypothetical protein
MKDTLVLRSEGHLLADLAMIQPMRAQWGT